MDYFGDLYGIKNATLYIKYICLFCNKAAERSKGIKSDPGYIVQFIIKQEKETVSFKPGNKRKSRLAIILLGKTVYPYARKRLKDKASQAAPKINVQEPDNVSVISRDMGKLSNKFDTLKIMVTEINKEILKTRKELA